MAARKLLEAFGIDVQNTTVLLALVSAGIGVTNLPPAAAGFIDTLRRVAMAAPRGSP